jgi:hypothetical protein
MSDFRISETALAAKRQQKLLSGENKSALDAAHEERIGIVANAMMDLRAAHINEPLAQLWYRLAKVALETE